MLGNEQWQNKYAGLMAISILSEGAAEHFKSELDNIMQLILSLTENNNPRMIYANMTAIAVLCLEFYVIFILIPFFIFIYFLNVYFLFLI